MNLQENEDSTGFTVVTNDPAQAFEMAERMAFSGYRVNLSGVKGKLWTVVVTETKEVNQHAVQQERLAMESRSA